MAGRYYRVFASDTLDGDWVRVVDYGGTDGTMTHSYNPAGSTKKFFKVEVTLDPPPGFAVEE